MKTIFSIILLIGISIPLSSQTLIATTNCESATANHNQRKVIRDAQENAYVVFVDMQDESLMIKGLKYDVGGNEWSDPSMIINGTNPTLAIGENEKFFLVYESQDFWHRIFMISSEDFEIWSDPVLISDTLYHCFLPVADVDPEGFLNVFYIQENEEVYQSLIYTQLSDDTIVEQQTAITKAGIMDVAVANHLQFWSDDLFFAIQFDEDSLEFFWSDNHLQSYESILATKGTEPTISFNSYHEMALDETIVRFLFVDPESQCLLQYDAENQFGMGLTMEIVSGNISNVCIDNILPPIGYSFLYMENGILNHAFSYGNMFPQPEIMETIYGNEITHPSVAYRHFNPLFIDMIWMEEGYKILHKRDDKHVWIPGLPGPLPENKFNISGTPNPFSENLKMIITIEEGVSETPEVLIYDVRSVLIRNLQPVKDDNGTYICEWNGLDNSKNQVGQGIYLILCTSGSNRTVKKVVYNR